jgi:hypothetical protein
LSCRLPGTGIIQIPHRSKGTLCEQRLMKNYRFDEREKRKTQTDATSVTDARNVNMLQLKYTEE